MRVRDARRASIDAPASRAPARPAEPRVARALVLQRAIGNSASVRLLQRRDQWTNAPDAKHWHRDRRWREYQAKKTKTPPKELGEFEEPLSSKAIEDLITKGGEKLDEAFSFYDIPKIDKPPPPETPAERALNEIQSASSKTREYLEYFNSSVEWVQRYGGEIDLGPMFKKLHALTGEVTKRLNQVEDLVDDVRDAAALMRNVARFSTVMRDGRLTRENADEFIDAAEDLYNAIEPYAERAKDAAKAGAMTGSGVAARAFLLVGFVMFEVEAGLSLLKAGKQAADKWNQRNQEYLDDAWEAELRRHRRAEEAARKAEELRLEAERTRPLEPAPWRTRAEQLADEKANRQAWMANKLRQRWAEQRDSDRRWAMRYFAEVLWPERYKARRGQLRRTLKKYFDVMSAGGNATGGKVIGPGDEAWIWWHNVETANPSRTQLRKEIENFERMRSGLWMAWDEQRRRNVSVDRPACPFYAKMYNEELDRYLAGAGLSW